MLTKIYLCPADKKYGCTWEGSSDDIFKHFSEEHEDLLYFTGSIDISLEVISENRLLLVDTEIYLLQTKISDEYLNIYLRYLGPSKIAANLTYDINITSNGRKMGKQDIEMRDGYFTISLECLNLSFGTVDMISCELLISGDFTSNGSNDSVFVQDGNTSDKTSTLFVEPGTLPHIEKSAEPEPESARDSTPNLEDLFSTPKDGNSPVEIKENSTFDPEENKRATWYEDERDSPKERVTLLNRSQTFTYDDVKKNTGIRRQTSMRSLGSIAESDLDSELTCSNCDSHLASPIFLCVTGHNMCPDCYRERRSCSICDKEITSNRNEDLEGKSNNYQYSCMNKKNGCPRKLPYAELGSHEINCTFCQYVCPMEECRYQGGYKNMTCHLSLIHSSVKMFQSFIAVFQKYEELFLVNEIMGIFHCSWKQVENKVMWKAKFCGPKARKFFCELKFKGKHFKTPLLLTKHDDFYFIEMLLTELKEQKLKAKNSILTIAR